MEWLKKLWRSKTWQIRRDWTNWVRPHRRLLRRALNCGDLYSLPSLLDNAEMRLEIWATPDVASAFDTGTLHAMIKEAGDELLIERKWMEGFVATWIDGRALGALVNFTGIHTVEAALGFHDEVAFRGIVEAYFRDRFRDQARGITEVTSIDPNGALTQFGLAQV